MRELKDYELVNGNQEEKIFGASLYILNAIIEDKRIDLVPSKFP